MHYTRRQVLKEIRFYLMLPAMLAPSFIITAMFFFHLTLADNKGWSAQWVTGNYWVFAFASIAASLIAGPIIDRITAKRIMPFYLLPMIVGLSIIWIAESAWWLLPYLLLTGLSGGLFFTGVAAMWTELYGAKNIGAIKSLMTAITVLASALSPVTGGVMLDVGMDMATVYLWFAAGCVIATGLFYWALKES